MSDDPITATAKAVEETAKATGTALEILRDVFGQLAKDLVGLVGDWVHEQRIRIRDRWCRRTAQILEERNVKEFVPLSPNVAAALVEGAQEESRDELAELWARLLANAMDPKMNNVRHSFIEAVKAMDPLDAMVLERMYRRGIRAVDRNSRNENVLLLPELATEVSRNPDDVEVSLAHLLRLGLFVQQNNNNSDWWLTADGRVFLKAVYPEVT